MAVVQIPDLDSGSVRDGRHSTSISAGTSSAGPTTRSTSSGPRRASTPSVVDEMSWWKGEPDWMAQDPPEGAAHVRAQADGAVVRGQHARHRLPGHLLLHQAHRPSQVDEWDELPEQMKATYEKLGIPEAERKYLAGVTAQYESEVVYHRNREELAAQGILFCDMDTALREYPDLVKQYFGTVIPPGDNKFAALNSAVWSRRLVHLRAAGRRVRDAAAGLLPHQQRERRPVRAHADHRRRGLRRCTTSRAARPRCTRATRCTRRSSRSSSSPSARVTYTTIQNWSPNVYNLVTKRARVEAEGHMEWIDGNIGSKLTMKYPSRVPGRARRPPARCCRVAYAGAGPAPGRRAPRWSTPRPRRRRRSCRSRSPRTAASRPTAASSASRRAPTAARATCSATR